MNDAVEFYHKNKLVASVKSSIVPAAGDLISINKKTWEIVSVTFALDYSDQAFQNRAMRANVAIEPPHFEDRSDGKDGA